jgi:hypothetical protein
MPQMKEHNLTKKKKLAFYLQLSGVFMESNKRDIKIVIDLNEKSELKMKDWKM